jgi:hypothetical protein
VADPASSCWEVYTRLEDVDHDDEHEHHEPTAACCTPVAGEASACCW